MLSQREVLGVELVRRVLQMFRASWWRWRHADFLTVFNWHQITPVFDAGCHHEYTWTQTNDFETELNFVAAEFQVLPLHEGIERLKRGSLRGACASLTFDDGDVSAAEHVLPLLRERKLPATFFINSAYLDGRRSYWFPILTYLRANEQVRRRSQFPVELQEKALQLRLTSDARFYDEVRRRVEEFASLVPPLGRLVSTEWLSSLDGDQFTIGAHGHEHQRYAMMSPNWQENDLRENVRILSQFRAYRPVFAIPFGRACDWTVETIRIAREQGMDIVLADGGVNIDSAPFYRRIPSDGRKLSRAVAAAIAEQ